MNETHRPRRILRSIGAVLVGVLAIFILSIGTDAVLHAIGVFPPFGQPMSDALFLLAMGYRIIYGVATSYLVARLAPGRPMRHALVFGLVGVVIGTAGMVAAWGRADRGSGPSGTPWRSSPWRCRAPGRAADSLSCRCGGKK